MSDEVSFSVSSFGRSDEDHFTCQGRGNLVTALKIVEASHFGGSPAQEAKKAVLENGKWEISNQTRGGYSFASIIKIG
jgi:hypothetical protein